MATSARGRGPGRELRDPRAEQKLLRRPPYTKIPGKGKRTGPRSPPRAGPSIGSPGVEYGEGTLDILDRQVGIARRGGSFLCGYVDCAAAPSRKCCSEQYIQIFRFWSRLVKSILGARTGSPIASNTSKLRVPPPRAVKNLRECFATATICPGMARITRYSTALSKVRNIMDR
jgi:hypothetical protein